MELFLSRLLEPVGIIWALGLTGGLVAARQRQWRSVLIFGFIVLFVWVGGSHFSTRLLASLERPYAGLSLDSLPDCDAVVMLGGVVRPFKQGTPGLDFDASADRAVAALELMRRGKAKVIVFGGGGGRVAGGGTWQEGSLLQEWSRAWGLVATNVLNLPVCANTFEEAQRVRELAQEHKWQRVLLVTSAYHMQRAEGIFRRQGIFVVPVGADFEGLSRLAIRRPFNIVPTSSSLDHLRLYLHEKIGWWYYRLRGRLE